MNSLIPLLDLTWDWLARAPNTFWISALDGFTARCAVFYGFFGCPTTAGYLFLELGRAPVAPELYPALKLPECLGGACVTDVLAFRVFYFAISALKFMSTFFLSCLRLLDCEYRRKSYGKVFEKFEFGQTN